MRSVLIASLVAVAGAHRSWSEKGNDWATHPDETAQWLEEHVGYISERASPITTVVGNQSSIVKLECVGCPFRVRKLVPPGPEEWQEPPQDNSLLLNFTIDASTPALLLNGHPIAALAPMPLHIRAFQVNANLSSWNMFKAISLHMMDESFNLSTKYGTFELQYEHTVVATREPGKTWIQFDITGILYPPELRAKNPNANYELRAEDQKMVQILLHETAEPHTLSMEDIQIVVRKDRAKPYKMKCGRPAMAQTTFNPLEWDYYGKIGTWSRSFNLVRSKIGQIFWDTIFFLPALVFLVPAVAMLRWMARVQQRRVVVAIDDAEAVLLDGEQEDAPPEYEDVLEPSVEGEKA